MSYKLYALLSVAILFMCSAYTNGADRKEFRASIGQDGVQRVDILGGSYFFAPNYIIVKVNVPVEIRIRKEGILPHNFIVKAPNAGMDINVDLRTEPKIIKFTPEKTGSYPFYCDNRFLFMSSHQEKGMEGIIEVRE